MWVQAAADGKMLAVSMDRQADVWRFRTPTIPEVKAMPSTRWTVSLYWKFRRRLNGTRFFWGKRALGGLNGWDPAKDFGNGPKWIKMEVGKQTFDMK